MRSGEAYNFSLFEDHSDAVQEPLPEEAAVKQDNVIVLPNRAQQKRKKAKLRGHAFRAVASCVVIVLMVGVFSGFVYGQVQLSELAIAVSDANQALSEQESVYTQLQMQNESQQSLSEIEEKATTQLGMSKIDSSRLETVDWNTTDKGQVVQSTDNGFLAKVWSYIQSLFS